MNEENFLKDVHVFYITRISKKTNNPYSCLELRLVNGYKKMVFLEGAEQFMFEQLINSNK